MRRLGVEGVWLLEGASAAAPHSISIVTRVHRYRTVIHVPVSFQPAIEFCIERLKLGEWVHIFPEGRVNVEQEELRYKWGVGRLVARAHDCAAPLVLPVWHEGMDQVTLYHVTYLTYSMSGSDCLLQAFSLQPILRSSLPTVSF